MSALVIYLTHHNNTQLRTFPSLFKRKFHNESYSNLNFLTALYKDTKIMWQVDDMAFPGLCSVRSSPHSIADFFDCISRIKQENQYEDIILCLEANLGEPAATKVNPIVRDCVERAGASQLTFFSSTPECLEAAKIEYSHSSHVLFEPHGINSITSHLDLIKKSKSSFLSASDLSHLDFSALGMKYSEGSYDQYIYFGSKEQLEQLEQLSASNKKLSDGVNDSSFLLRNDSKEYSQFYILDKENDNNRSNHEMDVRAANHDARHDANVRLLPPVSVLETNALFQVPRSEKVAHNAENTDESFNDSKSLNSTPAVGFCCCFFSSAKVYVDMPKATQNMLGFCTSSAN